MKGLDVGCGHGTVLPPGWQGMDLFSAENVTHHDMASIPWPFADQSFEVLRMSHSLEHVGLDVNLAVLQEAHRILTVGGIVEIEVPELESVCRWFLSADEQTRWGAWNETSPARWLYGQQNHPGQFHTSGFTIARLQALLAEAGFYDVTLSVTPHGYVPVEVLRATGCR